MTADKYFEQLAKTGVATLRALDAFEGTMRRLHPPAIADLRTRLAPHGGALETRLAELRSITPPADLGPFHEQFLRGAELALRAVSDFVEEPPASQAIARVLGSMSTHCRALEALYPLHQFPPLGRYFVEPAFHDRLDAFDPEPNSDESRGLHHSTTTEDGDRGGFSLYVPERYDEGRAWPLVVALHGGSGVGRDFLWTWLREARGRGFLLLAPTSRGSTWSLMGPDVDAGTLHAMVAFVRERWQVDEAHVLLTGLSDGATFALLCGLEADSPFTALAPVSGVVHPAALIGDRAERLVGRRIRLVHGTLDWMFPIELAHNGRDQLLAAGADLAFCEIEDLSHAYPREENDRILTWFDPTLALPSEA